MGTSNPSLEGIIKEIKGKIEESFHGSLIDKDLVLKIQNKVDYYMLQLVDAGIFELAKYTQQKILIKTDPVDPTRLQFELPEWLAKQLLSGKDKG